MADVKMEEIDEFIGSLLNLQHIDLSKNMLDEIPGEVMNKWRYLRSLHLSHNNLSALPKVRFASPRIIKYKKYI